MLNKENTAFSKLFVHKRERMGGGGVWGGVSSELHLWNNGAADCGLEAVGSHQTIKLALLLRRLSMQH